MSAMDDVKGVSSRVRLTSADCPACGMAAPIGRDDAVIGVHGDGSCMAAGRDYRQLRRIARQAGSWLVRWAEGGEARERACGEREGPRLALRYGGVVVSPAVIEHLKGEGS